jgi:hypothetical protein
MKANYMLCRVALVSRNSVICGYAAVTVSAVGCETSLFAAAGLPGQP